VTSELPQLISDNPTLREWFAFEPQAIVLKTGKVEIGQGILIAFLQIAAEELDLPLSSLKIVSGDTVVSPNEGPTVASLSIMLSGPAIKTAAVCLRNSLFKAAANRLNVRRDELTATSGQFLVSGSPSSETYWSVSDDVNLDDAITADVAAKDPSDYRVVGTSAASLGLVNRISGAAFIHDLTLPDYRRHAPPRGS
jgi:nicotinate dehydrogenase subunit B